MLYGWIDCPEETRSLVLDILNVYRRELAENLVGFYLHGSLAMDCYNPLVSDIDFLAIVQRRLPVATKERVIACLIDFAARAPAKGLEMSIALRDNVERLVYPTPFELHYSRAWQERYLHGQVDFVEERVDTDLAAHFVVTRERGICLYGEPISSLFRHTPRESYVASLLADAAEIFQHSASDPLYSILNLTRILAYLEDSIVLSKREAIEWARRNVPSEYRPAFEWAERRYLSTAGDAAPDGDLLRRFVCHMKIQIEHRTNERVRPETGTGSVCWGC
jgi:streptomycin 3"-adenylyltransferase